MHQSARRGTARSASERSVSETESERESTSLESARKRSASSRSAMLRVIVSIAPARWATSTSSGSKSMVGRSPRLMAAAAWAICERGRVRRRATRSVNVPAMAISSVMRPPRTSSSCWSVASSGPSGRV